MQNNKKRKTVKNPDPMSDTRSMAREGMRIIKDIAFGKFNIYNQGHVFKNYQFITATLSEANKRMMEAMIHVRAIEYAYYGTQDPTVLQVLHRDKKTVEAYSLVCEILNDIIRSNGDTGLLWVLANRLPIYKYNI